MTIDDVLKFFGTQTDICEQLQIHRQNFSQWKNRGYIPYHHQLRIEKMTKGKLKADFAAFERLYATRRTKAITKHKEK